MGNSNSIPTKPHQQLDAATIKRFHDHYYEAARANLGTYSGLDPFGICKPGNHQPQPSQPDENTTSEKYNDDEPLPKYTVKPSVKNDHSTPTNPDQLFSCSFKLRYSTLQVNTASETIEPALFTLKTENTEEGGRAPLDLICVLDTSGSMGFLDWNNGVVRSKILLLKNTLKYLVDLLGEDDRISIVSFDSTAQRVTPLQRVTETNKPEIIKAIDSLRASGGTNITAGMTEAVKILNDRNYKNSVASVFLLSDGLDANAIAGVQRLLQKHKPKDIFTINSFGYGNDHDPNLMSSIAKLMDGKFYFIEKLDAIDECFSTRLGDSSVSSAMIQQFQFKP